MKAFAKASPVKTDRKDAHLIALALKAGLYRGVHVKTDQSQRLRFLLTARELLMRHIRQLEGTMRGSFKAFGLRMGNIAKRQFAERAQEVSTGPRTSGPGSAPAARRPPQSGLPAADDGPRSRHYRRTRCSYHHRRAQTLSPVGHRRTSSRIDAA
jgi:transposase